MKVKEGVISGALLVLKQCNNIVFLCGSNSFKSELNKAKIIKNLSKLQL